MPGLDPAWSRLVQVADADGVDRVWHLLDTHPQGSPDAGTLLCVHGNPTWSYLWRGLVAAAPPGWRVLAVDQLGMGWSQRLERPRTLAQRVDDLGRLTAALGVTGPVVTVAHDWGGPVSLGWALAHRHQLRAVVLTNTAVHQPAGDAGPALIRLAHLPGVRQLSCVRTPTFVRATTALSRPALPAPVRDAFAAPYATADRRGGVGDFVADIPFADGHPSRPALDAIAEGLRTLDVPALLMWGPRDPVFGEAHLRDLRARLPQAQLHRYEGASHLVTEDAPQYATDLLAWLEALPGEPCRASAPALPQRPPLWAELEARRDDTGPAVVEVGGVRVGWAQLHHRVTALAQGLVAAGVRPGDRVALLVPPSADLTATVYAIWRAGAVIVVADRGLGLRGMGRALRGAGVDHVVGTPQGLAAAAAMRLPGTRIATRPVPGVRLDLLALARTRAPLPAPDADAECAVVFTSGATGPPKGVVYRHRQVQAQVELIRRTYALTRDDRLVAAFAPFAIYGPALGVGSAVPDVDVTRPGTLTAAALADAVAAVDATVVFASPAALRNVVATQDGLRGDALGGIRLLMSAGAPVGLPLLRAVQRLLPRAALHTPYGMTEALPVTDVSLTELAELADAADAGAPDGVCVGRPLPGVQVRISPLSASGTADGALTDAPGVTGEVCVRAEHVKDRYDALWATERRSSRDPGWHRTGDVGHLDPAGRLWVEGRLQHVVTSPRGPLTPVGVEQRVETLAEVSAAAVVGVGPAGTQAVVVVVVPADGSTRTPVAGVALSDRVRAVAGTEVAAVLVREALPVDVRHASKVDRAAVARWASSVLAGP